MPSLAALPPTFTETRTALQRVAVHIVARARNQGASSIGLRVTPDEETLARHLDTCFLPDPDLVIRTSGEARISNFLLWQSAYAEYEFIDTLWPDFTREIFAEIVHAYAHRERRFGAVAG